MSDIPKSCPRLAQRGQRLAARLLGSRFGGSSPGWRTCSISSDSSELSYETEEALVDALVRMLVDRIKALVPAGPICNLKCTVTTEFDDCCNLFFDVCLEYSGHDGREY